MNIPKLFIGCSAEAITIARAIQYQLRKDAAVTIWDEDPTFLGSGTLKWLVSGVANYDFALMVFTPDDKLISRGAECGAVRDNILFELGLFMARLGPERTFIVFDEDPQAQVKVPSDLKSIGFASFSGKQMASTTPSAQSDRYDYHLAVSALGPACSLIRASIKRLGSIAAIHEVRMAVDQVEKRQEIQEFDLKALEIAVRGILTKHERGHLQGLMQDEYYIPYEPDLYPYLHRLDGLNFIQPNPGFGLIDIVREHKSDEQLPTHQRPRFNLKRYVYITEDGKTYLKNYLDILIKRKGNVRSRPLPP